MSNEQLTKNNEQGGEYIQATNSNSIPYSSIIFRSIAIFAILYQLRLLADDLADTAVFSAALFAAFAAAFFMKKLKPLAAVISIALVPLVVRVFIAIPGMAVPGSVNLDSLLFNFDRNNFITLLPFYWIAVTTWFSIRSRLFLRAAVIADAVLIIIIFGFTRVSELAAYRWPIVMIILLAGIIFFQSMAFLFSLPPETMLRRNEKIAAIAALLLIVVTGGFLFLKPSQERAAQKGGGLLEPKLFSFDFSQYLRLETEISMADDLVFIVKKNPEDDHILLRRSVMSGYGKRQGFYRIEEIDEKVHPLRLPARQTKMPQAEIRLPRQIFQEYFIVNFDAAAFIGMKEPIEITPYDSWDSSSFKSAYAVESITNDTMFFSMDNETWPSADDLGLSEKEFTLYTSYGEDERIRFLAEEVTRGIDSYAEKIDQIHFWLKYGEYRYSLKPGIAPDGDQLGWFLFNSKKGYCSYYAFAMALMLRSLGIPARVAAGFFIDTESGIFDYYPVRSDMAHAWVEVPFPGYGWVEFDPTSENMADDEEYRFSSGVDPNLLERLMREILENRSQLRAKMGNDGKDTPAESWSIARLTALLVKKLLFPLLLLSTVCVFVIIRCGYFIVCAASRNRRKKALYLWKHTRRRLRLAGIGYPGPKNPAALTESEWALRSDSAVKGTYSMYLGAAAARFAPEYQNEHFISQRNAYRLFCSSYRNSVPLWRRILAWIIPPLALMRLTRLKPQHTGLMVLLLFVFLANMKTMAQNTEPDSDADALYHNAIEAEYSEYWERAIDLLREGSEKFPEDTRFPRALGRLYYSRSLYSLAWDEYRKVELMFPSDTFILHRLANIAGYLNRERTSVAYLEKLLTLDPDNKEAIGNLGWMYYKIHRLKDGEQLLLSALDRLGDDADLSMTLATVYSDMYRYNEAKYWYQKAISLAEPMRNFTAVAHYNLSILESRFYHYDLAMESAIASLDAQHRASGLLARSELDMRRLQLEKAQADILAAREIDYSPLAKLNLAQAFQISGRLEEGRLYAVDCLKASDHSWMMHYGIDPTRYKRDIHEILYKTYSGLHQAERFTPNATLGAKIKSAGKSISYKFYYTVHRKLYQKYSLAAGDAYREQFTGGASVDVSPLDQFIQYYNAFETYPRRAVVYLNKARNFETAIISASEASYNLEEGILLKDRALIVKALGALDQVWELDLISWCYREFATNGVARAERQAAASELFALNRGSLLQSGIRLPVAINLSSESSEKEILRAQRKLNQAVRKAGFIGIKAADVVRYRLDMSISASPAGIYSVSCELIDLEGELKPLRRVIPMRSLSKTDIYSVAGTLSNAVFRVE